MIRYSAVSKWVPLVAVALVLSSPAAADWIVTHDGHRVETLGAWRVEGKMILFDLPTGELASMRASEVDLEASAEATAESISAAAKAADPPPEPSRPSVYSLTDADVGHVEDEDPTVAARDDDEEPADSGGAIAVTEWNDETDPDGDGILLRGTVSNQGSDMNANVQLVVRLYDEEGGFIVSSGAQLSTSALPPGEAARFEVLFPGVFDYSAVRFETDSTGFVAEGPSPAEDEIEVLSENET